MLAFGHGQDVGAQHPPFADLQLQPSPPHHRRRPKTGVGEGVPLATPFLEEDDPVEAGRGSVMAQCGQGGGGFLRRRLVGEGHMRHPRPPSGPQQRSGQDAGPQPFQEAQVSSADSQVHDGTGRDEGGHRPELEPKRLVEAGSRPSYYGESFGQVTGPYIDGWHQGQVRSNVAKGAIPEGAAKPVRLQRYRWVEQQSHAEPAPWAHRGQALARRSRPTPVRRSRRGV